MQKCLTIARYFYQGHWVEKQLVATRHFFTWILGVETLNSCWVILHMDHCQKSSWQLFDVSMCVCGAKKCLMAIKHFYPWIFTTKKHGGHKCLNTRMLDKKTFNNRQVFLHKYIGYRNTYYSHEFLPWHACWRHA